MKKSHIARESSETSYSDPMAELEWFGTWYGSKCAMLQEHSVERVLDSDEFRRQAEDALRVLARS